MKIECILQRKHGSSVTLDDTTYHFKPSADDPRHIADVSIQAHIRRFLGIPEGYQSAEPVSASVLVDSEKPAGSLVHPASYALADGTTISLEELVSRAFKESGMPISEWNELSDEDRYEQIEVTLSEIKSQAAEGAQPGHYGEVGGKPADAPENSSDQPAFAPEAGDDEPEITGVHDGEQANGDAADAPADAPAPAAGALDRDALAAEYERRFGRKPHGRLSAERIKEVLEEPED
ncbi:hypothetical protein [Pseudomonas sp.]|uniref:hypothetical protein n=1 Tax=Pseudomonas sp. TaxID=306 RepID=UPI002588AF76|nr:hypothetical protein [Pseudomonas sp.]